MFIVDKNTCNGCGICIESCLLYALYLKDGKADIDNNRCIECGTCLLTCPTGAISTRTREPLPSGTGEHIQNRYRKEVIAMPRGYGCGFGGGYGRGYGFRGSTQPPPYVSRGRGGLPRCAYPGLYADRPAGAWEPRRYDTYHSYGDYPYPPAMSKEDELKILREEASAIKYHLDRIEGRIKNIETEQGL